MQNAAWNRLNTCKTSSDIQESSRNSKAYRTSRGRMARRFSSRPFRGKLKENWPELFVQARGARKQIFNGVLRILQFLVVGEKTAALHSKNEIRWRCITPRIECFGRRQTVEAVVQLYSVEVSNVVVQHLTGRQFRGVERTLPVLVVKPGGTDTNVASHVT